MPTYVQVIASRDGNFLDGDFRGVRSPALPRVTRYAAKWVAPRYPSADRFLRSSSQARAALRCFVSQMGDEKRTGTQYTGSRALWSISALGATHQQPTRGASRPELRAVRSARDTDEVQNVDRVQNSDNNAEVVAIQSQLPPFCGFRKECRPLRSVRVGVGSPVRGFSPTPLTV